MLRYKLRTLLLSSLLIVGWALALAITIRVWSEEVCRYLQKALFWG